MKVSREIEDHIRGHLQYPATKTQIPEQCSGMSDVPEEEKSWLEQLPERRYRGADDVLNTLTATVTA